MVLTGVGCGWEQTLGLKMLVCAMGCEGKASAQARLRWMTHKAQCMEE